MPSYLYLHHDRNFDLVSNDQVADEGLTSLGEFEVETRGGTERRQKVQFDTPGNVTTIELPDEFDTSPVSLLNLIQAVTDRHAAEDDIHSVSGTNPALVGRVAALLNAEVREVTVTNPTETEEPIDAPLVAKNKK